MKFFHLISHFLQFNNVQVLQERKYANTAWPSCPGRYQQVRCVDCGKQYWR